MNTNIKMPLYSVIIPVFNSEKTIFSTVEKVVNHFKDNNKKFEVILVNDCSEDDSWNEIIKISNQYKEVLAINHLKNYGQHLANISGFKHCKGDYVITMDDDLQNPPHEIIKLINKISGSYDLVIGEFLAKKHGLYRRLGSKVMSWLTKKIFKVNEVLVLSNFRIADRKVINRICNDKSTHPYIPGLFLKYSSKRANVKVEHHERKYGKSSYTLNKIIFLVFNLLFNHSSIPLYTGLFVGFFFSFISFLFSFYYLITALFNGAIVPGWASIIIMLSFFNGILILLISLIGEYIIRILREVISNRDCEIIEIITNE